MRAARLKRCANLRPKIGLPFRPALRFTARPDSPIPMVRVSDAYSLKASTSTVGSANREEFATIRLEPCGEHLSGDLDANIPATGAASLQRSYRRVGSPVSALPFVYLQMEL